MIRWSLLVFAAAIGCTGGKKAPPAPPPAPVTVLQPVMVPVQAFLEYNGTLEPVEAVQIQARVEGFLTEITFTEGDEVAAGRHLYTIEPAEYESAVNRAQAEIVRADANIVNAEVQEKAAKDELDRLVAAGGASATELQKAQANVAERKAQKDIAVSAKTSAVSARKIAELKKSYTEISSPIDGRISRTLVTKGNLVGQKEPTLLTTIVSVDPLFVMFDVPEKDRVHYERLLKPAGVAAGPAMTVKVGTGTEQGFPHSGPLDFQDNRVTTSTGTLRVRGRIPNPWLSPSNSRRLQPGLYCRVRVPIGEPQPRFAIPEEALMTGQEGRYVFVLGPENVIQKRTVTVGPQVWRMGQGGAPWTLTNPNPGGESKQPPSVPVRTVVSIESGLKEGDRIVAVGLLKARPGQPVAPDEWTFRAPAPEAK